MIPTVANVRELPRCCGRGVSARGTAGKGEGTVYSCSACYRDVGIVNGAAERAADAEYQRGVDARLRGRR